MIDGSVMAVKLRQMVTLAALLTLTLTSPTCLRERLTPPAEQAYKLEPGPFTVRQETHTWRDAERQRYLPVRIYRPAGNDGPVPPIILSPGFGISRDHYVYLGNQWASYGYLVVCLSHADADETVWESFDDLHALFAYTRDDPESRLQRSRDVSFAIDRLAADPLLGGLVDLEKTGLAGHSLGAFTALSAIGMRSDLPDDPNAPIRDPRIKAAVAFSPTGTGVWGLTEDSWVALDAPCMTFIGSLDFDFVITVDPQQRRVAFERSAGPDQYLVTLGGALHTAFDDFVLFSPEQMYYSPHHDYIRMATTAFFDAYLRADAEARDWLVQGALETYTRGRCRIEYKNVTIAE